MTLPKSVSACPLCGQMYVALANHLRRGHSVRNNEERSILLKLCTGRIPIREQPCPVPGCFYHSSRLDKHLESGHSELTDSRWKAFCTDLKRRTAIAMLAKLRASQPAVAMATTLDINVQEDVNEACLGSAPEGEEGKAVEEVCDACQALKAENASLKSKVDR